MIRHLIVIASLLLSFAINATEDTYELVFIDIWGEYVQPSTLAESQYPRRFIQLDMNVAQSDINKFVSTYPHYTPLEIDKNNSLSGHYGIRSTPTIVQIQHGKMVNKAVLSAPPSLPNDEHQAIAAQHLQLNSLSGAQYNFKAHAAKARLILFSDALCPARHLPHCEHKAIQHNEITLPDTMEKLTVIKPFYVSLADVKSYQERLRVNHPVLFDQHNALFRRYGVTSLPYWLILDKHQQVIYRGATAPEQTQLAVYSSNHSD
ncbi:redoxin domain-containing protein [Pseudoalteromonas sp. T1lg23B]|uniref:redoxin domain-containing protein n=1 Tax=Pseudoalteromonas sp. T1lg23B TaxID=2077097 RepID=UPI000CF5FA62|nr:redoxin domain-containing protein [Pseudoalteromonas sp. T1lg23B]